MNLLKKLSTLVFIFSLFLLGIILVPVHKADATVAVNVSANPPTVNYNGSSTITWSSSAGVTSCSLYRSDTGATVSGLAPSGSYPTGSLIGTTTFTVTCSAPAYCSGTYINSSGVTSSCSDFTTSADTCLFSAHCVWVAALIQCGRQTCVIGCKDNPNYPNHSNISCSGNTNTSCLSTTYPAYPNCTWNP